MTWYAFCNILVMMADLIQCICEGLNFSIPLCLLWSHDKLLQRIPSVCNHYHLNGLQNLLNATKTLINKKKSRSNHCSPTVLKKAFCDTEAPSQIPTSLSPSKCLCFSFFGKRERKDLQLLPNPLLTCLPSPLQILLYICISRLFILSLD